MVRTIGIADRAIGEGCPVYVTAEIGINHNGDIGTALELIDAAVAAGCDAVKLQKRTPRICTPAHQRSVMRKTPWGRISYLDYRRRIELDEAAYEEISRYCEAAEITWFSSCWDTPSVEFLETHDAPAYKIPSAAVTDLELLDAVARTGKPKVLSTGMSTMQEIRAAVARLGTDNLLITHCTSSYPCPPDEANLRMIPALSGEFGCPVGYSGHEQGLPVTLAAVALGACYVERHVTLDRAMWGSDHAASIEPGDLARLVRDIRTVERALGDGVKRVYESEFPAREKLRCSS